VNKETQDKIRYAAPFLRTEIAQKAKPYLHDALALTLDILDCVSDEWQIAEVIAQRLFENTGKQVDTETINQSLNACKSAFHLESKTSKHGGWKRK
jgi:hypothetical protein